MPTRSGLRASTRRGASPAASEELGLSAHNAVAIGDAENDHALLEMVERSAAVANAVPMLKAKADIVRRGERGAGVEELIDRLIDNDLRDVPPSREERRLVLGTRANGRPGAPRVRGSQHPGFRHVRER